MGEWFLLSPDGDDAVTVDATHRWSLPGVHCDVCGQTWASTGPAFPRVDLDGWAPEREYRRARAVPLHEYQRLRDQLQAKCRLPWPLSPGAELGPLQGRVRARRLGAFVWQNPWTLLATSAAVELLGRAGQVLPAVATRLTGPLAQVLREVECVPLATVRLEAATTTCSACGRHAASWPRRVLLVRDTLPTDVPVFRIRNLPTMMVASRVLVDAIKEGKLTGIQATPVETCRE